MLFLSSTFGDFCHPLPSVSNFMSQEESIERKGNEVSSLKYEVNAYVVLQVRRDATPSEIREAYRRLSLWHHPGRSRDICEEESKRRSEIFSILGFSYETLAEKETRQMYDVLLQNQRKHAETRKPRTETIAPIEPSTTNPSCVPFYSCSYVLDADDEIPSLITSESINESEENKFDLNKYDSARQDSLFLLRKARNNRPFTNAYDLFDSVFGSTIYPRVSEYSTQSYSLRREAFTPAWTGETRLLRDGNVLAKTSRVLHNRRLTRTELISKGPEGAKCLHVTVKSEDVGDDGFLDNRRIYNTTDDSQNQ
eukprot:CAMPEP_0178909800 /NCGR_PEP_ID=MMETSP0786-20121207/8738_1 /TAXON_ID=186022 /ORGANISM="Thalassionema frauenfeldii, Strain CCMP 1798" /LENGTH=309 /DNA_ID=CAMNT_0020581971 /DNA_START=70 /DNA_END=996 /DNA_ORIENTATION=+